jgi:hypothetical protein
VVQNQSVTVLTHNFPANETFNVTMGLYGTYGIGGILVSRLTSGVGGSFLATFRIPPELYNQQTIHIRLQSTTSNYFAVDYFENTTATVGSITYPNYYYPYPYSPYYYPTPTSSWVQPQDGSPGLDILSVEKGVSVNVRFHNLPANTNYAVSMADLRNSYNNGNIAFHDVSVFNSAAGGIFNATFTIPEALRFIPILSIRMLNQTTGRSWYSKPVYNR